MPEKETLKREREDEKEGESASTQAGEFVREEMRHIREGKHGARSKGTSVRVSAARKAARTGARHRGGSRSRNR